MFSGAGGSSWGATSAGVQIVAAFDSWDVAGQTHAANFPSAKWYLGRVEDLDVNLIAKELGKIDIIIASPECTSHSPARGKKPGSEESRNTAFQVVRFAEVLKPRWVVIENVVSMKRWNRYVELKDALVALGYNIREQVLDASRLGVPQSRRRLFVMCDLAVAPAKIEPCEGNQPSTKAIVNLNGKYKWTPLKEPGRAHATLKRAKAAIKAVGKNKPFLIVYYGSDHGGGWQKLNRPLRTITTLDRFAVVKPSKEGHMMRMLQVEELKAAMGMPEEMKFDCGSRRDRIKMIGNAVCPPVMKIVITTLTSEGRKES